VSGVRCQRIKHGAWGKGIRIQVRHLGIEGFRNSGIKRYKNPEPLNAESTRGGQAFEPCL